MGLEKAIAHGKEHRKPYRDNDRCIRNRMYSYNKRKQAAIQKLKEYWQGDEQDFSKSGPSPFLLLSKKVKKLIDNLSPPLLIKGYYVILKR